MAGAGPAGWGSATAVGKRRIFAVAGSVDNVSLNAPSGVLKQAPMGGTVPVAQVV